MNDRMNHSDYLNRVVLVGASWVNQEDRVVRQREFYGTIESIDPDRGIDLRLPDGELFTLPPYTGALQPAEPGEYTLRSTREVVQNPDYLVVWRFSDTSA